jgi:hypothetical protein
VQPINQHLITDYLLGAASQTDTERLDKMSLTDGNFATQLRVAEDDLVDAYIHGELSGESLSRFKSHYLASPLRQEKVKVARSFLEFADRAATPVAVERQESPKSSWRRFFVMPSFALQWGFAALALIFLIGVGYLVLQNNRLRDQMDHAQTERALLEQREQELKRELEQQKTSEASTQQELDQVRERLAQLAPAESTEQPAKPVVVAFNLAPQTRGASQIPTVVVPKEANVLALTLDLEAIGFPAYEAVLQSPGSSRAIWRSGKLKATKNGTSLRVAVPANVLKAQDYIIELSSFFPSGQTEHAGSYSFRVQR